MKKSAIFFVVFFASILLFSGIMTAMPAEATKASGTPVAQYGSATKICGDKPCVEKMSNEEKIAQYLQDQNQGDLMAELEEKINQLAQELAALTEQLMALKGESESTIFQQASPLSFSADKKLAAVKALPKIASVPVLRALPSVSSSSSSGSSSDSPMQDAVPPPATQSATEFDSSQYITSVESTSNSQVSMVLKSLKVTGPNPVNGDTSFSIRCTDGPFILKNIWITSQTGGQFTFVIYHAVYSLDNTFMSPHHVSQESFSVGAIRPNIVSKVLGYDGNLDWVVPDGGSITLKQTGPTTTGDSGKPDTQVEYTIEAPSDITCTASSYFS